MYYRYQPYPYYRRYYSIDPYYYRRYYYPYYNVVDSQIADVDQSIINYGDMTDVIQDSDVYQSMAPAPKQEPIDVVVHEAVETPPEPADLPAVIPPEIPVSQPPPLNLP